MLVEYRVFKDWIATMALMTLPAVVATKYNVCFSALHNDEGAAIVGETAVLAMMATECDVPVTTLQNKEWAAILA